MEKSCSNEFSLCRVEIRWIAEYNLNSRLLGLALLVDVVPSLFRQVPSALVAHCKVGRSLFGVEDAIRNL